MSAPTPDRRDSDAVRGALAAAAPAFVPGWSPTAAGPGLGLLAGAAELIGVLADRVEAAPAKAQLAMLDLLGADLLPAQPARAPVVFTPVPGNPDARVPAGTRVGVALPGGGSPLVFQTTSPVALAAARLAAVSTLWPGRDGYADHFADLAAGKQVTLFAGLHGIPHHLYLADPTLALDGPGVVEVEVSLATGAPSPLELAWEHWDGADWRAFAPFATPDRPDRSFDGTVGMTRSGIVRLVSSCAAGATTVVAGRSGWFLRTRALRPLPPDPSSRPPMLAGIRIRSVTDRSSEQLVPDAAFAGRARVDLSNTFGPFGGRPQPGAVFAVASAAAFRRPGTVVTVTVTLVPDPSPDPALGPLAVSPSVVWEYWNGERWHPLPGAANSAAGFTDSGSFTVTVPEDATRCEVGGTDGVWWRARLAAGMFGARRDITLPGAGGAAGSSVQVVVAKPPLIGNLTLSYLARSPWTVPAVCLSYDDLDYTDHSAELRRPGRPVAVFRPGVEPAPALYLGFDAPPPVDRVGLYLDIAETPDDPAARTVHWEYWSGAGWAPVAVEDGTEALSQAGVLTWPGAADSAPVARFGHALHWLRGRLAEDTDPPRPILRSAGLNATWAAQHETVVDEVLGTGAGGGSQSLFLRRAPVLDGEVIEVRELAGDAAAVDVDRLRADVVSSGGTEADLRIVIGPSGDVGEVWVRWYRRRDLLTAPAAARVYTLEHRRGRVVFGDGVRGRAVPVGATVAARSYQAGGGRAGNVAAGSVSQVLGALPYAASVTNPSPAAGGADPETLDAVSRRAPLGLRTRRQAVTAADAAAAAREASPAVARAYARADVRPDGIPESGWLTVVILPYSTDLQPQPSLALRRAVAEHLAARMPAAAAGRLSVTGPRYAPVGAAATVLPASAAPAASSGVAAGPGQLLGTVFTRLSAYLHPLTGGPGGEGWTPGRGVHACDIAALVHDVPGVDSVTGLAVLLDGVPSGDAVEVPADRLVAAGPLRLRLAGRLAGTPAGC